LFLIFHLLHLHVGAVQSVYVSKVDIVNCGWLLFSSVAVFIAEVLPDCRLSIVLGVPGPLIPNVRLKPCVELFPLLSLIPNVRLEPCGELFPLLSILVFSRLLWRVLQRWRWLRVRQWIGCGSFVCGTRLGRGVHKHW
jgi:hypothetical protein